MKERLHPVYINDYMKGQGLGFSTLLNVLRIIRQYEKMGELIKLSELQVCTDDSYECIYKTGIKLSYYKIKELFEMKSMIWDAVKDHTFAPVAFQIRSTYCDVLYGVLDLEAKYKIVIDGECNLYLVSSKYKNYKKLNPKYRKVPKSPALKNKPVVESKVFLDLI